MAIKPREPFLHCLPHGYVGRCAGMAFLVAMLPLAACENQSAQPLGSPEAAAPPAPRPETDWLFHAPDEEERLTALQRHLRGLDVAMWEVGYRYEAIHDALSRENYELAVYHWDKVKLAIDNALERRPARRASAQNVFLDSVFDDVRSAFAAGLSIGAWDAFERARGACLACHDAENVAYMNNMGLFELRAPGR